MPLIYFVNHTLLSTLGGACTGKQADIYFLLDDSGSVGYSNFQLLKTFTQNVTKALDVGTDNIRVGVIKFGTTANIEIQLDNCTSGDDLRTAIGR